MSHFAHIDTNTNGIRKANSGNRRLKYLVATSNNQFKSDFTCSTCLLVDGDACTCCCGPGPYGSPGDGDVACGGGDDDGGGCRCTC